MIDYRFYKLNLEYKNYLSLEAVSTLEDEIDNLKSSSQTRQDLVSLKHKIFDILKSFKFIEEMQSSDPMRQYKVQKDKKHLMNQLYKIAEETFDLLKHKRKNMQEEFIFRTLYEKIYDISQSKIDDHESMINFKNSVTELMNDLDNQLKNFRRSFFTGDYSYHSPKFVQHSEW